MKNLTLQTIGTVYLYESSDFKQLRFDFKDAYVDEDNKAFSEDHKTIQKIREIRNDLASICLPGNQINITQKPCDDSKVTKEVSLEIIEFMKKHDIEKISDVSIAVYEGNEYWFHFESELSAFLNGLNIAKGYPFTQNSIF
ncbi:MAG: hypothetical protein J6N72_02870 [Psychrobacter sp.]|nr:hypothetical protein [Psychrobacter sp.]